MNKGPKDYLSPAELAARLGLSEKTLANWRALGQGPRWIRIGRSIRYPLEHVTRFERRGTAPRR